jgi:hypothetical protein
MELSREAGEAKGRAEAVTNERDSLRSELERVQMSHQREVGECVGKLNAERQLVGELR